MPRRTPRPARPRPGARWSRSAGYGRRELAPYSDLDVVLVHEPAVELGDAGERVWYPIWDSGVRLDHSVRTVPQMLEQADADLRVALGLLDLRHLAGDPNLTLRLRSDVLAQWRRTARDRLPALRELVRRRHELVGELAHLSVPDLKEAEGGLRDATVLTAWSRPGWSTYRTSTSSDRGARCSTSATPCTRSPGGPPTGSPPSCGTTSPTQLGLADDAAAQRHVRELGRRITHLSRLTWRRVDGVLARPASARADAVRSWSRSRPGSALSGAEVVLTRDARPAVDPTLLLRAAAVAAERDVELAPATAARLVAECRRLPDPWPAAARQALVRLLAAGRVCSPVWETLEETGALATFLPEWERIRLLPHASEIHRFTVDRHVVEACIEASRADP